MKIESIISFVNKMCDDERYTDARVNILKEWSRITEKRSYHLLNDNAKQLVKIIQEQKENGTIDALTNADKKLLNLMNESIRDLKLPYAKRIYIQHLSLFERQEAQSWLTSDARFVCNSWHKHL